MRTLLYCHWLVSSHLPIGLLFLALYQNRTNDFSSMLTLLTLSWTQSPTLKLFLTFSIVQRLYFSPLFLLYFYFPSSIYDLNVSIHQRSVLFFFLNFFLWKLINSQDPSYYNDVNYRNIFHWISFHNYA